MGLTRRHRQLAPGSDGTDPRERAELEVAPVRSTQAPGHVVDEFLETYIHWREECERVRSAYARWAHADASERASAFAVYRAALDREESAAHWHSQSAERVRAYSP